jgi:hypothetical protein
MHFNEGQIGGPGHVIQIDESKVGRRKNNKGRLIEGKNKFKKILTSSIINLLGTWVLGMLDEHTGQFRLEICPNNNRSAASLIHLIKKNIADGSVIMTDCWPSYNSLNNNGYYHLTVNHSINFVNQQTLANTQKIECSWRHMKTALTKGGKNCELMAQYLCEYLWRRHYRRLGADMFIQFMNDISKSFSV